MRDNSYRKRKLWRDRPHVCHWCKRALSFSAATVDHLVARSRGGSNQRNNLVLACFACNNTRGNESGTPEDAKTIRVAAEREGARR